MGGERLEVAWAEYIAAFAVFLASHSIPVRPDAKRWLTVRLGQHGFAGVYSALSILCLTWLIAATGRAPFIFLWGWAPWHTYCALFVMVLVCCVLALSIGKPNPFSFGGANNDCFDPRSPGMVRLSRHPLLLALGLWAAVHCLPNGDLAHVILFAVFTGFSLLGMKLIDRRKQREMGALWLQYNSVVRNVSALTAARSALSGKRLALAFAIYAALLIAHPHVIGVSPLP